MSAIAPACGTRRWTNLSRLLPKIEIRPGSDGVLLISAGGEFDASLLLADNLWSGGQVKVDGDIVVAVPAKDVLIATGSNNAPGPGASARGRRQVRIRPERADDGPVRLS